MLEGSYPIGQLFIMFLYQIWFAISYVLSQVINFHVGEFFFKLFSLIPFQKYINPCPHDKLPRPRDEVTVEMCYPYYYLFRDAILGKNIIKNVKFPSSSPVLFLVCRITYLRIHTTSNPSTLLI